MSDLFVPSVMRGKLDLVDSMSTSYVRTPAYFVDCNDVRHRARNVCKLVSYASVFERTTVGPGCKYKHESVDNVLA